jgi:hypothetical protein
MSNAFAPILRARPNPIFGRPVHQGSPPFDYSPILLLRPFGFRITPDTLPSGALRANGFRFVLAVSGFRLRARLDFSIPSCSPGQRGITPAFGYSAPHPSAEGTLTPMTHALPSAQYEPLRHPLAFDRFPGFSRLYDLPCSGDFAPGRGGLRQLLGVSLSPCCRFHPAEVKVPHRSDFGTPCCLRPTEAGSAFGSTLFRGHIAFTVVTAR